jgi:hypothetical protein
MMASNSQMPKWDTEAENPEHVSEIQGYKVYPCMEYTEGDCCNRYCFNYHEESTMRRPVCDSEGRLKYWSEPCEYRSRGQPCPYGYECNFAHSENESLYHPATYKTVLVKENARPWEANQHKDKRKAALKYRRQPSYQSQNAMMCAPCGPENFNPSMQPNPIAPRPNGQSAPMQKFRLCAYYPNVDNCRRKELCSFAHSREEITAPLLTEKEEEKLELSPEFFTERFKIHWCPIGVQHDWQTCVYAHNYQDARRDPRIGYGPRPCPFWEKKDRAPSYQARCPNGFSCPYAHGAKEQLYHPCYFKTVVCWDFHQSKKRCPRQSLCAFFHKKKLQRKQPEDTTDYEKPLSHEQMESLQGYFKNPPFFSDEKEAMGISGGRQQQSQQQQQGWGSPMQTVQPCGPSGYPEMPMYCVQTPTGDLSPQMSSSSAMYAPGSPVDTTPMFVPTMSRFEREKPFAGDDMRKMQDASMQSPMHTPLGSPMSSPMSSPMGSTPMMLVPVYAEEPYDPVPPMMMYPVDNMSMGPCSPCMPMMQGSGPFAGVMADQKSGHFRGPSQLSTTAEGSSQQGTDKSDMSDHEEKLQKKEMDNHAISLVDLRSTAPFFVDDM